MYLMYADESGDTGLVGSPTRYFVLTGVVVHELRWQPYLDQLIAFRRGLRITYGMKLREEFHSAQMLRNPGALIRIPRHDRLAMMREFADQIAGMADFNIINVVVDKRTKTTGYDVFAMAWMALIQRFENTMIHRNFRGPAHADERGIILPDRTDVRKLSQLMRRMRRHNPVPSLGGSGNYRNLRLD